MRHRTRTISVCGAIATAVLLPFLLAATSNEVTVHLRSRVQAFRGSGDWQEVGLDERLPLSRTALVICDMWDKHWCDGATKRVDALAGRISPIVDLARSRGILIVHAPSDTIEHYKNAPARLNALRLPIAEPPAALTLPEPPLPVDDSDGGCDTVNNSLKPNTRTWTKEHDAIHIQPNDLISDDGREIYNAFKLRGINHLLIAGVHTNMCVLNRSFAIRQMTKWGIRCILIRDLTDAMYNPAKRPFVSHAAGTELVIEHIEKYWAPTVLSADLEHSLSAGDALGALIHSDH